MSGESITLAHVPAGLTLVRIGKANSFLEAEIAAIADDLLLPDFVRYRLRRSA